MLGGGATLHLLLARGLAREQQYDCSKQQLAPHHKRIASNHRTRVDAMRDRTKLRALSRAVPHERQRYIGRPRKDAHRFGQVSTGHMVPAYWESISTCSITGCEARACHGCAVQCRCCPQKRGLTVLRTLDLSLGTEGWHSARA